MTTSLYQSGARCCTMEAASGPPSPACVSRSPEYTEDMRRKGERIELDVIARAMPGIAAAAEHVVDFVVPGERQLHEARLHMVRVQAYHHDDQVGADLLRV